jgi:triosephosphate isomerase
MNLTSSDAERWFDAVVPLVAGLDDRDLFVLPPFPAIWVARERLGGTAIGWGAQDVHPDDAGAHPGEVSAPMLADLGCRYVEVGHSERRRDRHETPEMIAAKVAAILRWGMTAIVCTGELEPADAGVVVPLLLDDLARCLAGVAAAGFARIVVAYEPAWAIGEGAAAAAPDHVGRVHRALEDWLAERAGPQVVPIVYGGSVDVAAAGPLLAEPGVDGLFVGRAALDPATFARIAGTRLGPEGERSR